MTTKLDSNNKTNSYEQSSSSSSTTHYTSNTTSSTSSSSISSITSSEKDEKTDITKKMQNLFLKKTEKPLLTIKTSDGREINFFSKIATLLAQGSCVDCVLLSRSKSRLIQISSPGCFLIPPEMPNDWDNFFLNFYRDALDPIKNKKFKSIALEPLNVIEPNLVTATYKDPLNHTVAAFLQLIENDKSLPNNIYFICRTNHELAQVKRELELLKD